MENKKLLGVGLIAIGVLSLLSSTIIPGKPLMLILCTVVLGYIAIKNLLKLNLFWSIMPATVLFIMYNRHYHLVDVSGTIIFFSMFIITIGLNIILGKNPEVYFRKTIFKDKSKENVESDSRSSRVLFGENIKYVNIENKDDYSISCIFGESNIYFNPTEIINKVFYVDLSVQFGEVNIYIPKNWKITEDVLVTMGELDNKQLFINEGNIEIILRGNVILGQVSIIRI